MEKRKYEEILENAYEKIKDTNHYSDWKERLTDEELALIAVRETESREEFGGEDDECLAKDILLLLKASRHSARHSLLVLEMVKDVLLQLSFPMH